ncbi:hypothetical protein [Clostridium sp.]|uniref:hypothetical protein n=1 Tax=Clostridium sp. TaxID=1506 RepID=UPI0026DCEA4A|nr:hypothetical protein [Clostridium sp.]MDO5038253.1 hypothetical protein [Clostridium sp.]
MKAKISIKGQREFLRIEAERIDILDIQLNGVEYKQIRVFDNKGSKSQYIESNLINWIKEE